MASSITTRSSSPSRRRTVHCVGVLEDVPAMRTLLNRTLKQDFRVWHASCGADLLNAVDKQAIDLVLLDILLPGEDGISIAKAIRTRSNLPVVMLSGVASTDSITTGLNLGADDYVTKPFQPPVLLARLHNALRRAGAKTPVQAREELWLGQFRIDLWSRSGVSHSGRIVRFTERELQILVVLSGSPGKVVERNLLSREISGRDRSLAKRPLDVHMCHLRKKLQHLCKDNNLITSFRGVGYALKKFDSGPDTRS